MFPAFPAPQLAAIDALRSQPAARVAELRTREVGDEADAADVLEADREVRTEAEALAVLLTRRWGEPGTVEMTGHLERLTEGAWIPEPERTLCGLVTEVRVWTVEDRWIGLGVAHWGPDGPLQLLAAAGEQGRRRPWDPAASVRG